MKRSKRPNRDIKVPARVVIQQSPGRITGMLSLLTESPYPPEHESHVEKGGLIQIGHCDDVVEVRTQPSVETLSIATTSRKRHFPDTRVVRLRDSRLVEFKPLAIAMSEAGMTDLLDLGQHYLHQGQPFDIFTDFDFDLEPRRSTAILLHHYARSRVDDERRERISAELSSGPLAVSELRKKLGPTGVQRDVYALIAQRKLCIDWSVRLDTGAAVSLPDRPFNGLSYDDLLNAGRFRPLLQELALGIRPKDQRLVAAARAYQRPIRFRSDLDFVGPLPDQAYVGRRRTVGSLIAHPDADANPSKDNGSSTDHPT